VIRPAKTNKTDGLVFAAFLLLQQNLQKDIINAVALYIGNIVTERELRKGLEASILGAHTRAAGLGRILAQNVPELTLEGKDEAFGHLTLADQSGYLRGLADDVVTGRYTTPENSVAPALKSRALLYARRLRGTADEAWVSEFPDDTRFLWLLGYGVEQHCEVCPMYASRSVIEPYTKHDLPPPPGSGKTPCKVNCDCRLRTVGGKSGFPFEPGSSFVLNL